jgi:hypothetical protein
LFYPARYGPRRPPPTGCTKYVPKWRGLATGANRRPARSGIQDARVAAEVGWRGLNDNDGDHVRRSTSCWIDVSAVAASRYLRHACVTGCQSGTCGYEHISCGSPDLPYPSTTTTCENATDGRMTGRQREEAPR